MGNALHYVAEQAHAKVGILELCAGRILKCVAGQKGVHFFGGVAVIMLLIALAGEICCIEGQTGVLRGEVEDADPGVEPGPSESHR